MISLFKMVSCEVFRNSTTVRGIQPSAPVKLFPLHNGHAHPVGIARVTEAVATSEVGAMGTVHNHNLSREEGNALVAVRTITTTNSVKDLVYAYALPINDEVPATLGGIFSSGLYALERQAILLLQWPWG